MDFQSDRHRALVPLLLRRRAPALQTTTWRTSVRSISLAANSGGVSHSSLSPARSERSQGSSLQFPRGLEIGGDLVALSRGMGDSIPQCLLRQQVVAALSRANFTSSLSLASISFSSRFFDLELE